MGNPSQTVLLLYPSDLDPYPFVKRLTGSSESSSDEPIEVPWTIDNKYYIANVTLQLLEVGQDDPVRATDIPVIVYLFQDSLHSVPATVVKVLMAEPRDVALAIRVESTRALDEDHAVALSSWESIEEMFEELGMEAVDETDSGAEEDDERPMSPIETVRQTLMTHMWPEMVRKPLGTRDNPPLPPDGRSPDHGQENDEGTSFPTTFNHSPAGPSRPAQSTPPTRSNAFPGLDELRAQIQLQDLDAFENGHIDRLAAMEDDGWQMMDGLDEEEYARLDEWLDENHAHDGNHAHDEPSPHPTLPAETRPDPGFEDDFEDFAAFQSAPRHDTDVNSLDPTPLLLHLQTIRTELAGVADDDERRVRAGREVARVMRDLGLGGDFDLDDLDDTHT